MKVLVTGGTGFIGSAVVRHLLAANHEVRILARSKKKTFLLKGLDVEIVEGDIIYPEDIEKAIRDCTVLFNLASSYTFYPFWEKKAEALYKINVQGTINTLNVALKNKIERFIHTGTIATIDKGLTSHYARSKYLAEQEILKFYQKGLSTIILNPAIVIGERDYKPTPSGEIIVKFLNKKYPGYFDTTWAVADVDDVARAHVAAIERGRAAEKYTLCNKRHYSMKEIFELLEEVSGVKAPGIKIPYLLLSSFAYIEELLSYCILKKKPLMPTDGVKFCRMSGTHDNSKAVNELGYTETPIKETLTKAVGWYEDNGYIKR